MHLLLRAGGASRLQFPFGDGFPVDLVRTIHPGFPRFELAELDRLTEETRLSTRKDLFDNALTLFMWAVKAKRAGRIIASVDERQNIRELGCLP
jgi:hypothetical protein